MKCPTNANGTVTKIGTSSVGTDLKPIKLVNGVPTAVSNDLVSTSGDQNIANKKTFTDQLKISVSGENLLVLQDKRQDVTDTSSSQYWNTTQYTDKNNSKMAQISAYQGGAYRGLRFYTFKPGGGNTEMQLLHDGTNNVSYVVAPNRTYNASNTTDVVTIGSLQSSTDVVHTSGNETIVGCKSHTEGLFGNYLIHNVAGTGTNYVKISYKANTTQFAKIKLCSFINNGSTTYFDILLAWNGGSARKLYVRRLGPSSISISNFTMAYDGTNLIMFFKCPGYHTVYADVENTFSWTNPLNTTVEYLTNPDLSGYTMEPATEV